MVFAARQPGRDAAMHSEAGFSLVEQMIIIAIIAVLAAVAIPAYHNYVNRSKQSEAISALMTAKTDQDVFWADEYRYASTIGCLASFGNTCGRTSFMHPDASGYKIEVDFAGTNDFRILATRQIHEGVAPDILEVSNTSNTPLIHDPEALNFSLFKWLFE